LRCGRRGRLQLGAVETGNEPDAQQVE
jgi:hypothetical protein